MSTEATTDSPVQTSGDEVPLRSTLGEAVGMSEPTSATSDGAGLAGAEKLTRFDEQGNPETWMECPNCGANGQWVGVIEWACIGNSGGRMPDKPCSRRCELQLEHAAALAAARGETG